MHLSALISFCLPWQSDFVASKPIDGNLYRDNHIHYYQNQTSSFRWKNANKFHIQMEQIFKSDWNIIQKGLFLYEFVGAKDEYCLENSGMLCILIVETVVFWYKGNILTSENHIMHFMYGIVGNMMELWKYTLVNRFLSACFVPDWWICELFYHEYCIFFARKSHTMNRIRFPINYVCGINSPGMLCQDL